MKTLSEASSPLKPLRMHMCIYLLDVEKQIGGMDKIANKLRYPGDIDIVTIVCYNLYVFERELRKHI